VWLVKKTDLGLCVLHSALDNVERSVQSRGESTTNDTREEVSKSLPTLCLLMRLLKGESGCKMRDIR